MSYTLAPFNPLTPYQNQVSTELNIANTNFTILGQAFYNNDPSSQYILRASCISSAAPSNPVAGTIWLDTSANPPILKVYDGSTWKANTPLNANYRVYDYVPKTVLNFDPGDFTMSNSTNYLIGSADITTPSKSPSGAWKVLFVVKSTFAPSGSGLNNFTQSIKFDTTTLFGAYWLWNSSSSNVSLGVSDTFLMQDLPNGITKTVNFYVSQAGGTANAIFQSMQVEYYLIPA